MSIAESIALACPRCDRTPLDRTDSGWHCAGCKVDFPDVGGITCLVADPDATLGEWRARLRFLLQSLEVEARRSQASAETAQSALTRKRLTAMADAKRNHAERLQALLAPLALDTMTAGHETYLALRTRLPSDQGLTTYYANVHRDWCWGDDENEASLAIVADALDGRRPGKLLVLGSGAGRLAYDLHERADAEATVALDFNPLLVLIAQHIAAGESIELHEFPLAPKDSSRQAVLRDLSAPAPAREGLMYCIADAHRPPFAKKSFDTIVTPWLVDILPEDFASFARRINQLLADGGRWVNFGSLTFHGSDPAEQLGPDECIEAIEAAGFATPAARDIEIPYLSSPASRHARRETVLSWIAEKREHVKKLPRHEALPDWLVRGKDPVPDLEFFRMQAMSTRIHAFIMSLIDGRRSIADMAGVLEEQRLMTRAEAEPAVRSFLIKLYEDSRRR